MGISRLKRLISEDLYRAFNLSELRKFCSIIQPDIDFYKLTGYTENLSIPTKEAAVKAVDYFHETKKLIPLLNLIIQSAIVGFKGEKVVFNNLKHIFHEIVESGYNYNPEINKIVIIEKSGKRTDWGFLEEGLIYNFCFVSIDICDNSKLFQKYETSIIRQTYQNFKNLIKNIIEKRDGRIWAWEGDGGIAAFHIKDYINQAVLAAIDILSAMPIFNATSNYIDDDILIRIGINAGDAEYKNDIDMIDSESINKAKIIEKKHTYPMSISIFYHTYQHLDAIIKNYFINEIINGELVYNLKMPLIGVKFEL